MGGPVCQKPIPGGKGLRVQDVQSQKGGKWGRGVPTTTRLDSVSSVTLDTFPWDSVANETRRRRIVRRLLGGRAPLGPPDRRLARLLTKADLLGGKEGNHKITPVKSRNTHFNWFSYN